MDSSGKPSLKIVKKVQIPGNRIQLIKISFDHTQPIYELLHTPRVLEFLTLKEPTNIEEIRQYILFLQNQWNMNQDFTFMILLNSEANSSRPIPIGQVSLYDLNFVHKRAEIGIWLGSAFWKKGYATEALQLELTYSFEDLQLNRLQAHIFLENKSSQRLFEKVGFQREGIERQYVFKESHPMDVITYALLKQDWLKLKK